MVAQASARSWLAISFAKSTWLLLSLPATASHLLTTMTHARPSAATSSARRKSFAGAVPKQAF